MPDLEMPQIPQSPQDQPQMVDINSWAKKFKASEKIMKREFKPKWKLARTRIRTEHDVKNRNSKKLTHQSVGLAYSIGQSFVNSVYFKAPNCNLTAREEVEHERVENTEIKVNDWLKDKKVKKTVRRNIWDAYAGGFGARFIDYEFDDTEDPDNVLVPGQPAGVDEFGQAIPEVPPQFGRLVLKNEIVIKRIRPDLVRFPKGFDFDNYQDSPWIGFDIITPIEEVKNKKDWDEAVRNAIEGEKYSKLSDDDKGDEEDDDSLYTKISYVFERPEYPDVQAFKLLVFCHKYTEKPLFYEDYDKGHVGYPIKFLYFNPLDDDSSYPNGDCWNCESMFAAIDTWWRKFSRHVEKSNPKTFYDSGAVSKQEIQAVKANNDLEFVGLENKQKRPIGDFFYEKERAAVHPDVSRFYEVARQLMSEISPRSGISRGAQDNKVDTATEAKIMQVGEVIDIDARVDDVRDYIVDIVLDVSGILEKSLQGEIPINKKVVDQAGNEAEKSFMVQASGFTSKIIVDVDVESMQAQNKDVLFKQLLELLGILAKFEPIMNKPKIDPLTGQIKNGKTLDPVWWLERILETRNIRNVEKGIVDLPPMPVMPVGIPPATGGMPPDITSGEGNNQQVQEEMLAARV